MKKVIIGSGESWPEKRNPEFDRIYKKGANGEPGPAAQQYIFDVVGGRRNLEPECIPKDIWDVIHEGYREILKKFGKPHTIHIPIRFKSNFFSSESVISLYRDYNLCGDYARGFYYCGMRVTFSQDSEELYIEHFEGEDHQRYCVKY